MTGANRSRGQVPLPQFDIAASPRGASLRGGADSGAGAVAGALSQAMGQISQRLGEIADREAVDRAGRAGAIAGLDPEFRPLRKQTMAGRSFDAAAIRSHREMLDTHVRTEAERIAAKAGGDPVALARDLDTLRRGLEADLTLPGADGAPALPELLPDTMATLARLELSYARDATRQSLKQAEDRQRMALASGMEARLKDLGRMAYNLGLDGAADDALAKELTGLTAFLSEAGPDGAALLSPERQQQVMADAAAAAVRARVEGAFDRLDGPEARLAMVERLRTSWAEGSGPMKDLDHAQVETVLDRLTGRARTQERQTRADAAGARETMRTTLAEDLASIARTGEPVQWDGRDLDFATVADLIGEDDARRWQADRGRAQKFHAETTGFATMAEDDIIARVEALAPKGGEPDFRARQALYDDVHGHAVKLLTQRRRDPAATVEDDAKVMEARAAITPDDQPGSWQRLVQARMQAQAARQIPELARKPLTNDEAARIARPLTAALTGADSARAVKAVAENVTARYGPFAGDVMVQLLKTTGVDRAQAEAGVAMIRRMTAGETPRPAEAARADTANDAAAADGAMTGDSQAAAIARPDGTPWPRPNSMHLDMLMKHPDTAQMLDRKFGPGSAEAYLQQRRRPVDRPHVDDTGALAIREDGGTMRLHPDGTESWEPDQ